MGVLKMDETKITEKIRFNIDSELLPDFFECIAAIVRDDHHVGLDYYDINQVLSDADTIEFYLGKGDTPNSAYQKLTEQLPKEKQYNSIFLVTVIKRDDFKKMVDSCGSVANTIAEKYVGEDGDVAWAMLESDCEEPCVIYLFCPNKK